MRSGDQNTLYRAYGAESSQPNFFSAKARAHTGESVSLLDEGIVASRTMRLTIWND